MTLEELADLAPRSSHAPVPVWTYGSFIRRGAVFADGAGDTTTRAFRLQAHSLIGDLRVPASRPDVSHRSSFHDCTVEELLALAVVDGGVSEASWSGEVLSRGNGSGFQPGEVLSRGNGSGFQPEASWPEPGCLQRIGPSLFEFAPSGAYGLEWLLQPGSSGLLVALRLMFETGLDGLTRPRDGGLLICGDHCLFALDRRRPLPSNAPVQQQMRAAGDPFAFADMAFDGEVSYARRQPDGTFKIALSTNPFREGQDVPVTDGFVQTSITEVLRQHIGQGADGIVRQWRIDTLMPHVEISPTTETDPVGAHWLKGNRGP